jgi:HrpA-like RNA helicase
LIILRELLKRRPDLKIILMSATLNAALFADYFEDFRTTVIEIPGRTFPVDRMYLEDAIEVCGYELNPRSDYARNEGGKRRGGRGGKGGKADGMKGIGEAAEAWVDELGLQGLSRALNNNHDSAQKKQKKQKQKKKNNSNNNNNNNNNNTTTTNQHTHNLASYSERTVRSLLGMAQTAINPELVTELVAHLALNGKNAGVHGASAILVFMPGLAEITDLFNMMKTHPELGDASRYRILPLHSSLPSQEQKGVFLVPPAGVTKIVLSTNIAETSVTINDISVVIDAGTHKEMQYDPAVGMSCLKEVRVAKANAAQRAGRAGRVRPGYCFHMFMSKELDFMSDQQLPEMKRCPLESTALKIKALRLGYVDEFLRKAIEPPSPEALSHVVAVLKGLSAMNTDSLLGAEQGASTSASSKASSKTSSEQSDGTRVEELTPLGVLLAKLPVDPRIGKMMLYGAIFRALEPVLIIASSLAFRSPFFSPFDKRAEADAVKKSFDPTSDHMTVLQAYLGWQASRKEGRGAEREYLHENFLSRNTLGMIDKMKNQFQRLLTEVGFYSRRDHGRFNENATNLPLVKAILVAGLYPNVVKIEAPKSKPRKKGRGGGGGSGGGAPKLKTCKLWDANSKEEMVALHPSSVLYGQSDFTQPFLVFHEKVKTSQVYVRDATVVSPFALLLFGGRVDIAHLKGEVTLDNWLRFSVAAQHAVMIQAMRGKLMTTMRRKIDSPKMNLFEDKEATKVIDALCLLLR